MIHTFLQRRDKYGTYLYVIGGWVWYMPICEKRVGMEIPCLTPRVGISIPDLRPPGRWSGMEIPIRGEARYFHTYPTLTYRYVILLN